MAPSCSRRPDDDLAVRELMAIAISRELADGEVVLTGAASAIPLAACLLAQARHAPSLTILGAGVYINPRRLVPEFTAGWNCDPVAIADMSDVFAITELGIDVMFYGGMQIDRYGSVNLHYIPTAAGMLRGPGLANSALGHTAARTILYTERHDALHRPGRPARRGTPDGHPRREAGMSTSRSTLGFEPVTLTAEERELMLEVRRFARAKPFEPSAASPTQ